MSTSKVSRGSGCFLHQPTLAGFLALSWVPCTGLVLVLGMLWLLEPPMLVLAEDKEPAPPRAQEEPKNQPQAPAIALTEEQKKIQLAVYRAAYFLKMTQNAAGSWGGGQYAVGYAAMPGLALLEVGIPSKDVSVQRAANLVRNMAPRLDGTYELALAILFLDKLGEKKDVPIIRSLALRLVAGQNPNGGWTYHCPILNVQEERTLLTFITKYQPRMDPLRTTVLHPYLQPVPKNLENLIDPLTRREKESSSSMDPLAGTQPLFDPLANPISRDPKADPLQPLAKPDPIKPDPIKKEDPANPVKKELDLDLFNPYGKPDPVKKENPVNPLPKPDSGGPDVLPKPEPSSLPFSAPKVEGGKENSQPGDKVGEEKKTILPRTTPQGGAADKNGPPPFEIENTKPSSPQKVAGKEKTLPDPKLPGDQVGEKKEGPPALEDLHKWPNVGKYVNLYLRPGSGMVHQGKGKGKGKGPAMMAGFQDDNSNSQFAILGLWAARRHGIPMTLSLGLLDERYRSSQHLDGSWSYHLQQGGGTPSMTCVGLLGLGVAHGAFHEAALAQKKNPPPGLMYDPAIQKGLVALSQTIAPNQGNLNLYSMWSLERVMVMYQLPTLGNTRWYMWGAEQLLPRQNATGSWSQGGYHGSSETLDTAMAMLFLGRANLSRDLSDSLRHSIVVVDPAAVK